MRTRLPVAVPSQCEVCRGWDAAPLCRACIERFAAPRPRCRRCGIELPAAAASAGAECGECLRGPPPFARTVCAVDYVFPWDGLVAALKFRQRIELAAPLAARLADAVDARAGSEDGAEVSCVLAVPLGRQRLRQRGFNQAWELARRVAARRALPAWPHALVRVLDAAPQAGLDRAERARNLRGAFMVPTPARARLAGRRVALVDDVMTTGATAREAAAALRRAGAAAVELWVLARTPAH